MVRKQHTYRAKRRNEAKLARRVYHEPKPIQGTVSAYYMAYNAAPAHCTNGGWGRG